MKFQIASDLHLEYVENRDQLHYKPIIPSADILLLAGDTVTECERDIASDYLQEIESRFKMVVSVPGNHEYWDGDIDQAYPGFRRQVGDNHVMLNNDSLVIDGAKIIGSLLWSNIPDCHVKEAGMRVTDYNYIWRLNQKNRWCKIRPEDTNEYHRQSVAYLESELAKPFDGPIIVLTHYVPSLRLLLDGGAPGAFDYATAAGLDSLIESNRIDAWVFGHNHRSFDSRIGSTHMVSNPLGMVNVLQNRGFKPNLTIEVKEVR